MGFIEVICLLFIDFFNMFVWGRNVFVFSKLEDNLLDVKFYLKVRDLNLKWKEIWKRILLNFFIDLDDWKNMLLMLFNVDFVILFFFWDFVKSSRWLVFCYVDYMLLCEFFFVIEEVDEFCNKDFGYDLMNVSFDLVLSLVRIFSIYDKFRKIMIKRC